MIKQRKIGALLSYFNIIAKNVVNFMYTPFLLTYIGQSDYGLFQMTNSVIMGLSLLSMGFSSAYVKFYMGYKVKNQKEEIKKLNALYLILFLFISFLSLIVGFFLVYNVNTIFSSSLSSREIQLTRYLMMIMVINIGLTFPSSVFDSNIIVNERFIFQQGRQLIQTLLVPIISIPLILIGVGVLSIGITQTIVTAIFLILNINFCIKKLDMKFNFSNLPIKLLKELAIFSFFIFLNQMVDLVNNNVPNFILGIFKGAKQVATFAIAIQIKNMFFMLSTSLSSMFVPRVNEIVNTKNNKEILTNLMVKVGRIQMTVLFFVLGGFIVIGRYFINIWAGEQNTLAYELIIVMVLPSIIPLCQNIGIEIQRAMNKHIFRSISYTIFAIINILITIVGTIYWGLLGASLGYIVSIVFANGILMNWYYHTKIGLDMKKYWKSTLNVTIPFMVTTGLLLLLQNIFTIDSLKVFILFGIMYVTIYAFIHIKFVMNDYERSLLKFDKIK